MYARNSILAYGTIHMHFQIEVTPAADMFMVTVFAAEAQAPHVTVAP